MSSSRSNRVPSYGTLLEWVLEMVPEALPLGATCSLGCDFRSRSMSWVVMAMDATDKSSHGGSSRLFPMATGWLAL